MMYRFLMFRKAKRVSSGNPVLSPKPLAEPRQSPLVPGQGKCFEERVCRERAMFTVLYTVLSRV